MLLLCNYLFIFVGLLSCFASLATAIAPCAFSLAARSARLSLVAHNGFIVTDLAQKKTKKIKEQTLLVNINHVKLQINGQQIPLRALIIESVDGVLTVNGKAYRGTLYVNPPDKQHGNCTVSLAGVAEQSLGTGLFLANIDRAKKEIVDKIVQNSVAEKKFTMRVLLDEHIHDADTAALWSLVSSVGFELWDAQDGAKRVMLTDKDLSIALQEGKLYINNRPYGGTSFYIKPLCGKGTLGEQSYQGLFLVMNLPEKACIINCLDLEDYVYSVLRTESWPGWPLEINKVFAIVSRTYAISMALRAEKLKRAYHIKNTNEHQTYTGVHESSVVQQAIDLTRGMFITYDKQPIVAMFDACCGGVIPAHIADFNFSSAPYLAREYACLHCKRCRIYSWQTEIALHELEKLLKQKVESIMKLKDVKVHKKDRAGLVQQVMLKSARATKPISGRTIYSVLKDVKSYCFGTQKKGNKLIIKGRGYGHHIGLCQWGAREMVRDGWHYQRIVQFYYPGTEIIKLT